MPLPNRTNGSANNFEKPRYGKLRPRTRAGSYDFPSLGFWPVSRDLAVQVVRCGPAAANVTQLLVFERWLYLARPLIDSCPMIGTGFRSLRKDPHVSPDETRGTRNRIPSWAFDYYGP
jgi:hypothetical protein